MTQASRPPLRRRTPLQAHSGLFDRRQDTDPVNQHVRALRQFSSRQTADPFCGAYGAATNGARTIHEPEFNLNALLRLPQECSILGPCIDAMVTNTVGHGYRLTYVGPRGQQRSAPAKAEETALRNLLDMPGELGLQELLERVQRDRETVGAGYLEVGRNGKGEVVMLTHVPAHTLRKTARDAEPVKVERSVMRLGTRTMLKVEKRFRRYVQLVGERRVYFREFGDPRRIDPSTGDVNPSLSLEDSATEILPVVGYTPGRIYPMPRWLGQLAAILGGRQAELTNLDYFAANAIPAAALLVSGGTVTQESIDELDNAFTAARGRGSQNRIAIIEVAGEEDPADPGRSSVPHVELKPLHGERQGDAVFAGYEKAAEQKVRGAFRLPPVLLGHSQDHKYASAQTSFEVAESQVFGPERAKMETVLAKVLATLGARFWALRLNPPRITNPDALVKAMEVTNKLGAMTPNAAIGLANKHFNCDIKPVTAPWGEAPMPLSLVLLKASRLKWVEAITKPSSR